MIRLPFLSSRCLRAGLSIALLGLGGCAVQQSITKAEPTSFLRSTGTANAGKISRLPFERAWRDPAVDPAKYSHLILRPVTTRYLRTGQWQNSASTFVTSEREFQKRAAELARYWDGSLRRAFSDPMNRFKPTGAPHLGTLVVEIAMTEVVFGHPAASAASYVVPGGGIAKAAISSPSVAFEARVIDSATGRVVATASDRSGSKIKVIDVNGLTFTKANEEICSEWSVQLMQAFNREIFPTVKRSWISTY